MIFVGDCVELMAAMPDASVDAVVCDPPYGLEFMGKAWDRLDAGADVRQPFRGEVQTPDNPYGRSTVRYGYNQAPQAMQTWHEAWATEALRVLKPGGHLLAFGGTRTYHRLACAVEDAGFEIRDTLCWLYGSGFPKSLDVSKAIDKAAGVEREVVGQSDSGLHRGSGTTVAFGEGRDRSLVDLTAPATPEAERWQGWGTALKPAWESIVWAQKPSENGTTIDVSLCRNLSSLYGKLASLLDAKRADELFSSSPVALADVLASAQWPADDESNTRAALSALTDTSQFESAILSSLSIVSSWLSTSAELLADGNTSTTSTASRTTTDLRILNSSLLELTPLAIIQAASQTDGSTWSVLPAARAFSAVASRLSATRELSAIGSAIDEAHISPQDGVAPELEPIVVARKPLGGTVAANVLEFGTGALNVDECRIEGTAPDRRAGGEAFGGDQTYAQDATTLAMERSGYDGTGGRWPANVVLDEEAAAMLDEQTGNVGGGDGKDWRLGPTHGTGAGTTYLGQKPTGQHYDDSGGASRFFYVAKASRAERNAGLEGFEARVRDTLEGDTRPSRRDDRVRRNEHTPAAPSRNHHPTVKPVSLMRWLVRLVTPPGGLVLDPFAGSGTTGIACALEGFEFTGCEQDPDYAKIAEARIAWWAEHGEEALRIIAEREKAEAERESVRDSGQLELL